MIELSDVLTLIGMVLFVGVQTGVLIRWLAGRIDSVRSESNNRIADIEKRVSSIKESAIQRPDLDRELHNIEKKLEDMRSDQRAQFAEQARQAAEVNLRLDRLLVMLGSSNTYNKHQD